MADVLALAKKNGRVTPEHLLSYQQEYDACEKAAKKASEDLHAGDIDEALARYDIRLQLIDRLLTERDFESTKAELVRLENDLKGVKFLRVRSKLGDLNRLQRVKYRPAIITGMIENIKNIQDYKKAKATIDELQEYSAPIAFENKFSLQDQILTLHNKGISEEEKILEGYYNEFPFIKELIKEHRYKGAMQGVNNLIAHMNSYDFVYLDVIIRNHEKS